MARSGKSSSFKLQVLNMASASTVAEIAMSENGGAGTDQKKNAIHYAMRDAFLQTTGQVKNDFINKIGQLSFVLGQVGSVNAVSGAGTGESTGQKYIFITTRTQNTMMAGYGNGPRVSTGAGAGGGAGSGIGLGSGSDDNCTV